LRWVKQTLKTRHIFATSENAVRTQIAVVLIAFLRLRLAQATRGNSQQISPCPAISS
jgi:IS4 transposase